MIGWLFAMFFFPGIILHEYAHKKVCQVMNVPLGHVTYLNASAGGSVEHGEPPSYKAAFLISFAPLLINTFFAIVFGLLITIVGYGLHVLLLAWLSISFGYHAFPSNQDAKNLWEYSKKTTKKRLLLITSPFLALIYLANLLKIIWFDLIFAVFIFLIATGGFGFALIGFSFGGIGNLDSPESYIACLGYEDTNFCNEKAYDWCIDETGYKTTCSNFKTCLEMTENYAQCFDNYFYVTYSYN